MREFSDPDGGLWTATVSEKAGPDYKGRFHLVLTSDSGVNVSLTDVRWNTEHTARRTLQTMSVVELRRRLRSAIGRGAS